MAKEVRSSLIEKFSELADPRILLKTRHKLIDIVVITVCALLGGADDWVEIANWNVSMKMRHEFAAFKELFAWFRCHPRAD